MYILLLSVIYLAFISLGLPDSLLGSAWPTIYEELNVPISYMGIVTMIISGGTILSSLLTDRLTAKIGTKCVVTASVFLTALALMGFSSSSAFYQLCLWGIPYGLGAGAIDAALNNYVALHYTSKHMSWLHCFWGVGTIISPYVMSYTLTQSGWQAGYRLVSFLQLGIAFITLLALPLWKVNEEKSAEISQVKPVGLTEAFKIKGVLPLIVGFMAYCATESTATLWTSSYFEGVFNMSKDGSAALGSLVFIGITVGRFLAGFITDRLGDEKMIKLGTYLAFFGIAVSSVPIKEVAIVGFVLVGLGCAPIYPCIIHSTPGRFGEERSQSIIGIQMASAYFGATFMPPLFGLIAEGLSIRLMPIFLAFFVILMSTMISASDRLCKKDK